MTPRRFAISLLAAALALAACAVPDGGRGPAMAGDADSLMTAAETDLANGHPQDARNWLQGVRPDPLSTAQRVRFQLLQSEILLAEDRAVEALQRLPPAGSLRDLPEFAPRAEADRGRALFRIGDAVGGTRTLVMREGLLADPMARADNRRLLWQELQTVPLDANTGTRLMKADPVTRGWIEFATLSRVVYLDSREQQARLAQWRAQYPDHPADEQAAEVVREPAPVRDRVGALALLLPLSGPHAGGAEAVRDGFLAAWYGGRGDGATPSPVRVYDTGTTADTLLAAYRGALDEGADFLVGPLTREEVVALAGSGRLPVPVLALNYLDPGATPPFNLFQWGLAPEDEARTAAERAIADRQFRAVVLVPQGEWGERVQRAFQQRLEELGGSVVAAGTYDPGERDYSEPIRSLLALDASEQRHRALTNVIGVSSVFQPRRREDVNLVFVAARPEQARWLGPQLRFHRTGDLPVYATAQIYDGDTPGPDLNGLRFCDMPWMIAADGEAAALRSRLRTLFPARPKEYTRLLALGYDAYTLVQLIEGGRLQAGSFFPAASGTLSLRGDGVITRGLGCVEIRNGTLKPLDVPLASARR